MTAAEIDPTLVGAQPAPPLLDDGFSPPEAAPPLPLLDDEPPESRLGPKSLF